MASFAEQPYILQDIGNASLNATDDYQFSGDDLWSYQFKIYANFGISTLLNVFGLHLVVHRSPKEMAIYRWFLLNILFVAYFLDVFLVIFYQPYYLGPIAGMCTLGLLKYLHTPWAVHGGLLVLVQLLGTLAVSILCAMAYRLAAVYDCQRIMLRPKVLIGIFLLHILYNSPLVISNFYVIYTNQADQWGLVQQAYDQFPGVRPILDVAMCAFNPNDRNRLNRAVTLTMLSIATFFGILITVAGFVSLASKRKKMSPQTFKMHCQLSISLALQTFIPACTISIPFIFMILCLLFQLPFMKGSQLFGLMISSHSGLNAFLMILLTAPYREATIKYIQRILKRPSRRNGNKNENGQFVQKFNKNKIRMIQI